MGRFMRKLSLLLAAGGLAVALALAGCAQSPATGRNIFTGGLSPEDEVKLGREQHPEIVQEFGGEYDDPELRAYVDSLGNLLAQHVGAAAAWSGISPSSIRPSSMPSPCPAAMST